MFNSKVAVDCVGARFETLIILEDVVVVVVAVVVACEEGAAKVLALDDWTASEEAEVNGGAVIKLL